MLQERAHELAAVDTVMTRVERAGEGRLVAVTGPPGVGRSAFLDAVANRLADAGVVVWRARCSRLERDTHLGVARQLTPADDTPDVAGPVAVVVDDLQWIDEPSLAWLADLRRNAGPRLLVVAVCDGEAAAERTGVQELLLAADEVLRLRPLGVTGVAALLSHRGLAGAAEEAAAWTRVTGGVPGLLVSLADRLTVPWRPDAPGAAAARTRRRPDEAADHATLTAALAAPAPWRLRGRVAAALNDHPGAVRRFAHCAAVLGGGADHRLVARLAGLDPAEEAAAAHALRRLGWSADTCEPHVLWECVREIAEDGYGVDGWGELHARAATLRYAAGQPVGRVASHLLEVSPGGHPDAAAILAEAAADARRRGDPELAVRYLRRALREFPPDSPRRGGLLAALAEAERDVTAAGMFRHVTQALPLLASPTERAAAVARLPLTAALAAPPAVAEAVAAARAELARAEGNDERAGAGGGVVWRLEARAWLARLAGPDASREAVARLRELEPAVASPDRARRETLAAVLFTAAVGGQLTADEAATLTRRLLAREPASPADAHGAAALLVTSATAAEAAEPAGGWLDMALRAARERRDERQTTRLRAWRALAAHRAGRLAEAWPEAARACAAARGVLGENDWLSLLGLVSVVLETREPGLVARLEPVVAELAGRQAATGVPVVRAAWLALRAADAPVSDLPALAKDLVGQVRHADAAGWHNPAFFPMALWVTPVLRRLGETETALELVARECDRARAWGAPAALGRTLRVWGTLVPGRYALSLLSESVTVLRQGANRLELARALLAYGARLRAAGRSGVAELLAEADGLVDDIGGSLLRHWARLTPDETPVSRDHPGHQDDRQKCQGCYRASGLLGLGKEQLSVTERRVAALVALGHTNQDVAEELDVTRRAVEKCLTRLYRRLGVPGRAELVPLVRRMSGAAAVRRGVMAEDLGLASGAGE